jgi:F-type H+-transporting ATPase subunit b
MYDWVTNPSDPTFWVAIGTLIFFGLLVWKKVPGMIARALDARGANIAKELDETRRLRDEALALLAQYQAKQRDAEKEAEAIIATARVEAERLAAETQANVVQALERRAKVAEQKIAQAEAQAVADVKAAAADAAVAAAQAIIGERMDPARAASLADAAIRDLKGRLN